AGQRGRREVLATEGLSMKRLCAVLVLVSLAATGCGGPKGKEKYTIAFVPKIKGIPYFQACERGALQAGKELGLNVVYEGPTKADRNGQIDLLHHIVNSGEYNCLAVACTERDRVSPTLKEAADQGLPVVTYDADSQPGVRQFFVNMATYDA